jgi:hypothetical protein
MNLRGRGEYEYERPQLLFLIIMSTVETNKIQPTSYSIIPC